MAGAFALLDPRGLAAGLILGTAAALALRAQGAGQPGLGRRAGVVVPLAAALPPLAALALAWRPRGYELEAILKGGGALYGPALVTIALLLVGLARPFARRRGPFGRLAQRPLFWIVAPYAFAAALLVGLASSGALPAQAAPPGNATLTKTLTAQFTAGTVPASLSAAGDQLALVANTTPAAAFAASANTSAAVGAGGLTLGGGNAQVFLTLHGNCTTTTSYYDAAAGTFSAGPATPAAPLATIAVRSRSSNAASNGPTTITITKPAGVASGDVLIAGFSFEVGVDETGITVPTGWTLIRRVNNSNAEGLVTYRKVAGGAEPASYAWTFAQSRSVSGGIIAFTGVDNTTPIDVENGQATGSNTTHATPSITTTAANDMLVAFFAIPQNATWTPPAGMTEQFDVPENNRGNSLEGDTVTQAAIGATGAKTATASTNDVGATELIALRPGPLCNTGAFAIQRSATTYLVVRGGTSNVAWIVNAQGVAVGSGSCTVAFGLGCWTITTAGFTLTAGADVGAHAIKRTDGRVLVVHGGGLSSTTLYTPPGIGTEAMIAGPATSAVAGAGALSLPRSADTDWFTLLGNNTTVANRYRETGGTVVGGVDLGTFSVTGVTQPAVAANAGAFALQYTDGPLAAVRWLVVLGTTTSAIKYDPAGTLAQAYTAVTLTGYAPADGGHAFKRGDGTWILVHPGAATHQIWTPSTAAVSSTGAAFTSGNPGSGSHSFQRDDGQIVIVRGGASAVTDRYDAGWTTTGTYTSENTLDPGFVDHWDQIGWTTSTANGTTVTTGVRTAAACPVIAGAYTTFAASTTGSAAISSASGQRCIQAEAILARPVPQQTASTSAWSQVWLGSDGVFYDRVPVASPTLADYSLRLLLGQFTVTAPASATAGTPVASTVTLRDGAAAAVTDYTGAHTLVFSGANAAPLGNAATYADGVPVAQPFGANTAVTFAAGGHNPGTSNLTLYRAEAAAVSAIENFLVPAAGYYLCGGGTACTADAIVQLTTGTPAAVTVAPTAVSAANSTITPVVANVAASTVQAVTVTALDTYRNPISGAATTLSVAPVGPTLSAGANTNASGVYSGTVTTATLGTYTVSATVAATTITPTVAITFATTTGRESTPSAVKDTQTRLASGATVSNTTVGAGGAALNGNGTPSAAALTAGAAATGPVGAGAHTLLGNGGLYLVIHGGDNNATSVYDGSGAFSNGPALQDTSGAVTVTVPVGLGGHSFRIPSGTNAGRFLLVPGGQGVDTGTAHKTLLIDPAGWTVANGPAALSGTTGTATSGAGAGAFSIAFADFGGAFAADPRFLIVHAGGVPGTQPGTANTSIYDPTTNTIIAGPALTANAGAGAFGVVRPNGTLLVIHGNAATTTTAYTPAASPGIGTTAGGPAVSAAVSGGGHALRYTVSGANCLAGSTGGNPCYLIVNGGAPATTTTTTYDPTTNTFGAGPALSAAAGVGANTLLRADGSYLIVHAGGAATTTVFTPAAATMAAGPALTGAAGTGSHALQQLDHRYLIFRGNAGSLTSLHDAGWVGRGTYTSEWVDPGTVDSWTALAYTAALSGGAAMTIDLQVAATSGGASPITAQTVVTANGSATATLPLGSTSNRKWTRAVATLTRAVPAFSGEQTAVFLGAGYTVQQRSLTPTTSPTLSALTFTYRSGYFRITAVTPQTAGVAFAATAFVLVDDTSTSVATGVVADYTGTHTLVFSGANTAPNGTSVPTARNASAVDVAFGTGTTVAFTAGAGGTTFVLYRAETATPAAAETVNGQICPAPQSCGLTATLTIGTIGPSVVVNPANPDAAQSTASASPTTVPADDSATATLSIVVRDAFGNPSPGANTPRRVVTITRSAGTSAVIAAATGNVDAAAAYATTVRDGIAESVTFTIQISSGADVIPTITLTSQPTVTFAAITLVVTPLDAGGSPIAGPTVTAGQAFGLRLEAHIVSPSSTDTGFCDGGGSPARTCSLSFATTAGAAPDGTAPRVAGVTISGATFSAGFYTTSLGAFALVCANGGGVACLTQAGAHTITATAVQAAQPPSGSVTLTGTSGGFTVSSAATSSRNAFDANPAVASFVLVSPSAAGTAAAVGVPTSVSVWARVVDGFGNAAPNGRTVSFTTSLGTIGASANTSASAGAAVYGFAGPVALTAAAAGTATVGATVTDNGFVAQTAAVRFFDDLRRINDGTYYGTLLSVNGAAPVAAPIVGKGVPLAVVATDAASKPALTVSGTTLVATNACWTIGAGNATGGAFDLTGVPAGACGGTTTTSGAALAGQAAITSGPCPGAACRVTYWKAAQPGAVTLHAAAGSATFDYALTVAGYFQIATSTTPNGRAVTAFVDWDGTTLRVDGWFAPGP